MTTVSLALGSGGARGYAHIGVIEALEARGYQINCIAGSSMGALIGGLYASGALESYKNWVEGLSRLNIIRLLDVTFSMGAIRGERLYEKLSNLTGNPKIEDLPIQFTAVATDIVHQKEVWFQRGSLMEAIRASIAVPGVFTPVVEEHRVLVDGGVLNPLPIVPTVAAHSDLIIAVDLNTNPVMPEVKLPHPRIDEARRFEDGIFSFLKSKDPEDSKFKLDSNIDIIMSSLEVMQGSLSQYKIAGYPPDLLINIPSEVCRFHDFHRAKDVIEVGRKVADKALDDLERRAYGAAQTNP